jgi:hypothetical protein
MSLLTALMILGVSFGGGNTALAAYKCYASDTRCEDVTLPKGYTYAASPYLYLYKGERAKVTFQTNSDSVHQVNFAAYSSGGSKVSDWGYAGYAGGEDVVWFTAPSTGNYYIFAECAGGDYNNCTGGGTIEQE